jgi:hypothetical protein
MRSRQNVEVKKTLKVKKKKGQQKKCLNGTNVKGTLYRKGNKDERTEGQK